MIKKSIILLIAIIILTAADLPAQVHGKLEGIVIDDDGNPIPGVEINIISIKYVNRRHNVKSKDTGKFAQVGIYPGWYQVRFNKSGYMPLSTEKKIGVAETVRLQITMHKASVAVEQQLSGADRNFLKGIKLFEQEKYTEAADAYQKAIKLNPDQWSYYFNLGLAYKNAGKLKNAIDAFQKTTDLSPDSYSANKELGELLAKSENWEEAKSYYVKAVELNQDDPDTFYNYGAVQYKLGESEEALKSFLKAIELDPDYAEAYYQIGTIYISQNNKPEAIRNLEKFLELAPDNQQAPIAKQLLDYLKR